MKTKNVKTRKMEEAKNMQCVLCQANFDVWIDNLEIDKEKEEELREHFLKYCPTCTRKDEHI